MSALTSCLPGESDVAERYNRINQRAAVQNTGLSLAQAAQSLATYRIAAATVRKSPLDDASLTTLPTISDQENPEPVPPQGMGVVPCGKFGALAYFTAQPKGIPPLNTVSSTMARSLATRFGGQNVGLNLPNSTIEMPPIAKTMTDCHVGSDIMAGSPIAASGFQYKDDRLPDKKKVTWPSVTRNVTIPCPSGYQGVIKRDQKCTLVYDEHDTTPETGEILVGGYNTPNKKVRPNKEWRCQTADGSASADEIARFCRDPTKNMIKPDDLAINLKADSLQQILDTTGPGFYQYKCRANSDGTNSCDAEPYVSTQPDSFLRCDKINTPPLYVTNPVTPLTLDASNHLIGNPAAIQSCGRGWNGKLTARYLVRRCNLYQTVDGVEQLLKQSQTIYYIAYAAAQCATRVRTQVQCPVGNLSGKLPVERDLVMLKPVALDWRPRIPGMADWSTSETATNDSRQEVKDEAAVNDLTRGKVPYIVPDISRTDLASASTPETWSLKLAEAMKKRDPTSISTDIVPGSCNNDGDPCKTAVNSNEIVIYYDNGNNKPLENIIGDSFTYRKLTCSNGTDTCHPLLGPRQAACNGLCADDGTLITVSGDNFKELLLDYINKIASKNLPAGFSISVQERSITLPYFNEPSSMCELAGTNAKRIILIGFYNPGYEGTLGNNLICPFLAPGGYNTMIAMASDAVQKYREYGDLALYANHIGNIGADGFMGGIGVRADLLKDDGAITQKLQSWLSNSLPGIPQNPCNLIR
ncbi:MAG: hypothetical protein U0X91_03150 [Spirosomataceae bacterium]